MAATRSHWEGVYSTKSETAVSWYQPRSTRSLSYIMEVTDQAAPIIDVGGGASTLVDDLLAQGYSDVTVLDIAAVALAKSKARLGDRAKDISWIVADITQWKPQRAYKVWHDRAVFHFLTEAAQQDAYIAALKAGTHVGSTVIIATFALDGPEKCSGLPVQRYSPETLVIRFGPMFTLFDQALELHKTPWASEQHFSYVLLRREEK